MLKQSENIVEIEGILSEVDVREGEFKNSTTNMMTPYLSGSIKVKVAQEINKVMTDIEVPINFFASKFTNKNTENPAYKSIMDLKNNFTSIAASDEDHADRIRISRGSISENAFPGRDGSIVSRPQINASFFSKVSKDNCHPTANFQTVICVGNIKEEVDYNGELTGAIIVQGIIPQYGGKVDVVDFRVVNKDAIDYINTNWNKGDTLRVAGKVNFSSKTIHEVEEVEFGEPIEKVRTISTKELIITSGSSSFDGDLAFDTDEIAKALQERQVRLNELKKQGGASKKNEGKKNTFANLGF